MRAKQMILRWTTGLHAVAEAANQYTTECVRLQPGAAEITISVHRLPENIP